LAAVHNVTNFLTLPHVLIQIKTISEVMKLSDIYVYTIILCSNRNSSTSFVPLYPVFSCHWPSDHPVLVVYVLCMIIPLVVVC